MEHLTPPSSVPVSRKKYSNRHASPSSRLTSSSPQRTPKFVRKHFGQIGDVLRCGNSLPTVDSIQFDDDDLLHDSAAQIRIIRPSTSSPPKAERLNETDNNFSANDKRMGNQCACQLARGESTEDEDFSESTNPTSNSAADLYSHSHSASPFLDRNSRYTNSKTRNGLATALIRNGSSGPKFRCTTTPPSSSTDPHTSCSPQSTPNSPRREVNLKQPGIWQQIRDSSRERLHKMQPKTNFFRKFSTGPDGNSKPKKEKLQKKHKSRSVFENSVEASNDTTSRDLDEDSNFTTFRLRVLLKEGCDLAVRDASGSSDPYVKFRYNDRLIYKSNTIFQCLNPKWNEEFAFLIHDPTLKLELQVFDHDRFMRDDEMGVGAVDLSLLKLFEKHEVKVELQGADEELGYLLMELEITPLTEKQKNLFLQRAERGVVSETMKRSQKSASVWISIINVVLVEARLNQTVLNTNQAPDVFAKMKLGSEKYKSKTATKTFEPHWTEPFDFHLYDEENQLLDVMIRDKNNVLGKCSIDLSRFERELTKERWYQLDNDAGNVLLLITISGTSTSTVVANLDEYTGNRDAIIEKYSLRHSFRNIKDIGHLTVKVYKAEGLASADIGGKSDPFCVLELVNARLQTQTVYKTLNPTFDKMFSFPVKDIHESLEVTVYDEDPNKKVEFLGKIAIPLLKIRNCEKRWYGLKDRKLQSPAKGRILLELDVLWNPIKAAVRTFNPRERKFIAQEQRFKRTVFIHNVNRLKTFYNAILDYRDYMHSCLNWESYPRSLIAMMCFMTFVYFFELYQIPILLLLLFAKIEAQHRIAESYGRYRSRSVDQMENSPLRYESDDEDDSIDNSKKSRKGNENNNENGNKNNEKTTSIRGRISAIQDTLTTVQNSLDFLASLLEQIRNTFNFTVPYLSYLCIFVLCVATVLLYFVPLRWIILAWGFNKFTKRLRKPNYVENNEFLDFLSRVWSDQDIRNFRELKINGEGTRSDSQSGSFINKKKA
ncbi:Multiple C2 and transmembrane domain-containing protein 2 [Aphelenchoides besseyi]|nr:Multiple C2 and transmembrane domain-containing protein 2 [Aphelenchoides besseyi]KAI6208670.1 Multiple C2 and transmembrane domain-containing protein 2 [Aphelenchoides besseyi]